MNEDIYFPHSLSLSYYPYIIPYFLYTIHHSSYTIPHRPYNMHCYQYAIHHFPCTNIVLHTLLYEDDIAFKWWRFLQPLLIMKKKFLFHYIPKVFGRIEDIYSLRLQIASTRFNKWSSNVSSNIRKNLNISVVIA